MLAKDFGGEGRGTDRCRDRRMKKDFVFRCKNQNSKKKIPAPAWRLKSRRNKKRIATAACKSRDESNEPN